MKTILLIATGLALMLEGCAGATGHWENPAATRQDFYRDKAGCMAMANSGGGNSQVMNAGNQWSPGGSGAMASFSQGWNLGAATQSAQEKNETFKYCMLGKGYQIAY